MRPTEKIKVFIKTEGGRTVCICPASAKGCDNPDCARDEVTRDRYRGWRETLRRDKYGK